MTAEQEKDSIFMADELTQGENKTVKYADIWLMAKALSLPYRGPAYIRTIEVLKERGCKLITGK